jgi:hypothetical protein
MRKTAFLIVILALASNLSFAQFKEVPSKTKSQLKENNSLILGFINPKNFSISHSFNMSYGSYGNTQVSMASYTATLSYLVRDNMRLSADVSMQYSPYASIGSNAANNRAFQNSLSGINLSRVSFDYKPFKDMSISINYYNMKNSNNWMYNNYGFYNSFDNGYFGY